MQYSKSSLIILLLMVSLTRSMQKEDDDEAPLSMDNLIKKKYDDFKQLLECQKETAISFKEHLKTISHASALPEFVEGFVSLVDGLSEKQSIVDADLGCYYSHLGKLIVLDVLTRCSIEEQPEETLQELVSPETRCSIKITFLQKLTPSEKKVTSSEKRRRRRKRSAAILASKKDAEVNKEKEQSGYEASDEDIFELEDL
jgi:hypothetical protein